MAAAEVLFIMLLLMAFVGTRIVLRRRRLPGERFGQWLQRMRRYDAAGGSKDLMLYFFGFGLCITAGLFHFRQEVMALETTEKALLGVLCFTFTFVLPLLVWLVAKVDKKQLAAEDEAKRRFEAELRSGRVVIHDDDEDLDGR